MYIKTSLRDVIRIKENMDKFKIEISEKELEEEKRALERFTEQIEDCGLSIIEICLRRKSNGIYKCRRVFKATKKNTGGIFRIFSCKRRRFI
jgi:hypothetical protein